MSIASKLRSILNIKNQIRQSINRKGGNVSENAPFADYPRYIDSLNVDGTTNEAALKYFDFIENEVPSNFEDDTIEKLRSYLFYNTALKSIRCENVWKIGQYCFKDCQELEEIYFPNVTEVGQYAFQSCSMLTKVYLPVVTTTPSAFRSCTRLKTVILGRLFSISLSQFYNCYSLVNIVLLSEYGICKMPYVSNDDLKYCYHFTGEVNNKYNPEGLKDGTIYVPDDLVDTYKNTDYWTNYAEFIKPLSEFKES